MRYAIVILTTVVSCFSICPLGARMQDAAEHPLARHDGAVLVPQWVRGLLSDRHTVDSLTQEIDRACGEPLYLQISAGPSLAVLIEDRTLVDLRGDAPSDGHDLGIAAGRAAFALERLLSVSVPPVTRATSPADLAQFAKSARQQLNAHRIGALAAIEEYQIGKNHAVLARTYQDRIHEGIPDEDRSFVFTTRGSSDFRECLDAFFPIGKRLEDLEAIVGAAARVEPPIDEAGNPINGYRVAAYYARDSRFAIAHRFLIHNGVIEGVTISADE